MIFKREQTKAEPLAPEVQNELEQLEERKKAKDKCVTLPADPLGSLSCVHDRNLTRLPPVRWK